MSCTSRRCGTSCIPCRSAWSCNCLPTSRPGSVAARSTSPETWPRRSPSNRRRTTKLKCLRVIGSHAKDGGGKAVALPVTDLGCPTCGAALGPYEPLCPSCGSKLKQFLRIENLPPRQRELHAIANGAMAQASAHLSNAHRPGVKVDLADDLLGMAKKAAMQADFSVALDLASKSGEEAEAQTIQFEALQNRVRVAPRAQEGARADGAGLGDPQQLPPLGEQAALAGG